MVPAVVLPMLPLVLLAALSAMMLALGLAAMLAVVAILALMALPAVMISTVLLATVADAVLALLPRCVLHVLPQRLLAVVRWWSTPARMLRGSLRWGWGLLQRTGAVCDGARSATRKSKDFITTGALHQKAVPHPAGGGMLKGACSNVMDIKTCDSGSEAGSPRILAAHVCTSRREGAGTRLGRTCRLLVMDN